MGIAELGFAPLCFCGFVCKAMSAAAAAASDLLHNAASIACKSPYIHISAPLTLSPVSDRCRGLSQFYNKFD